jgi:hypothetical protein
MQTLRVSVLLLALGLPSCQPHDPPSAQARSEPTVSQTGGTQPVRASTPPGADDAGTVDAGMVDSATPDASPQGAGNSLESLDCQDCGQPQTEAKPSQTALFQARMRRLFDAIAKDDPSLAKPAFFPVEAYLQVKAVGDPARDHKARLVSAFERHIHAAHRRLPAGAKYLGVRMDESKARWVNPGEEVNKLGYYRVFGTALGYESEGKEHTLPMTSLIAWRGEWFIVHLTGFK